MVNMIPNDFCEEAPLYIVILNAGLIVDSTIFGKILMVTVISKRAEVNAEERKALK
jgi:hypothetical protein